MAEGQVYDIPAVRWEWFQEQIAKLRKKAEKLSDDKITAVAIGKNYRDHPKGKGQIELIEVFLSIPEIKLPGYTFVGAVDHILAETNVVRPMIGEEMDERFRKADAICNHCGYNRKRKTTYVLRADDATQYQVGSTCLRDFTGHHSADSLAKLAELLAGIPLIVRTAYDAAVSRADPFFEVEWVAQVAAQQILDKGWESRASADQNQRRSTADFVKDELMGRNYSKPIYNTAKDLAEKALIWGANIFDDTSDWAHNVRVLSTQAVVNWRHIPILVSCIGVYFMRTHKEPRQPSQYLGYIGGRLPRFLATLKKVSESPYGYRHAFIDNKGNHIVWFKDTRDYIDDVGKTFELEAKVRDHREFKGIKQTTLNYMKLKKVG